MKKYIILIALILLSSCIQGNEQKNTNNIMKGYIEDWTDYDVNKIEYIHKRGWKQTIYDKVLVLKEEPDLTEQYYIINEPKTFFDEEDQVIYYLVSGDTILTKEQWGYNIEQKKESIKNIMILSQGNQKYVLYQNSISKLSDFEKSWDITFNLGKYKTITIPE